ncbi:MAG TPA: HEPN domain-containing protein [Candidatus Obscuribacterales bacterium]
MTSPSVHMQEIPVAEDAYPPVTDALLSEAVRRLHLAGSPLKIALFGSRAEGRAHPYSDIDLLVVEEAGVDCRERQVAYLRALGGLFPDIDVVVHTIEDVASWRNVRNHLLTYALTHGRVLFEDSERLHRSCAYDTAYGDLRVSEDKEPKTQADLAKEWFENGDADLEAGRVIVEHAGTFKMACFHAQQAIEKYLKGFLILHRRIFSKTHNLDNLRAECCDITAELTALPPDLKNITSYCAALYAPGVWPQKGEAEAALAVAEQVRAVILAAVPPEAQPANRD